MLSGQKKETNVVHDALSSSNDPTSSPVVTKLFDLESAKLFFGEYGKELLATNRRSLSAFLTDPIIEVSDSKVSFTVGSKNVAREIEEETPKLLKRAGEKGWKLTEIECIVNAIKVSEYKVFSPKQQFDVLAKDYPILKEFESRFNLDFDA